MSVYYNEHEPYAAQWLRNLIAAGHIAPGEVDQRSIVEVQPDDLAGFTQCHFFAGIGVWSYSLRQAGWPDDRPVWTGSCPCQPFSAAGKGEGFDDERHLWPAWFRLIRERKPVAIFGEQVASKDALPWLDHVATDLEAAGYTFGAVDTCSAGFGAPHIRQRLYFVADAERGAAERHRHEVGGAAGGMQGEARQQRIRDDVGDGINAGELADNDSMGRRGRGAGEAFSEPGAVERPERCGDAGDVGNTASRGLAGDVDDRDQPGRIGEDEAGSVAETGSPGELGHAEVNGRQREHIRANREPKNGTTQAGACNGFWSDAIWLPCRDGKARPTKPGIFPLAHGAAQRVGRLRAYGNAINAESAIEFVMAFLDSQQATAA